MEALLTRPAWYVLGPLIGLVVVALFALVNVRIGVVGGFSQIVERATGRLGSFGLPAWFLLGVFAGSLVFAAATGFPRAGAGGFGWLTDAFSSDLVVAGALFAGGVLIGLGAKVAGGCTSGNGLGGCSAGSPASFAATCTFMATAVAVSFLIEAVL
ncbi:YeeE/YedE family protein [Thermoleophilia bacterium SCSIO 60948]|nr:YeeE/YedE family protein [Thermoleophilia bacterium SCSIO 60948]